MVSYGIEFSQIVVNEDQALDRENSQQFHNYTTLRSNCCLYI